MLLLLKKILKTLHNRGRIKCLSVRLYTTCEIAFICKARGVFALNKEVILCYSTFKKINDKVGFTHDRVGSTHDRTVYTHDTI